MSSKPFDFPVEAKSAHICTFLHYIRQENFSLTHIWFSGVNAINPAPSLALDAASIGYQPMVLLLQAELSDGEMDKAILIRLKPVPLDQDVESGH